MFDYISIIFIAVIALFAIIGLVRGGFKTVAGIIAVGAAVAIAVFVTQPLGDLIAGGELGQKANGLAFQLISSKISYSVTVAGIPTTVKGDTEINSVILAALNATSSEGNIWHDIYVNVGVPTIFYGRLDEIMNAAVAAYGTDSFMLASPVADVLTNAIVYGGTFLVLFLVSALILGIIVNAIAKALLKSGNTVGPISHLVGFIFGAVVGAAIVWVAALSLNLVMLMDSPASDYLREVLHMTAGDETFGFAKWCLTTDLGYSAVINFLIH